MRGEFSHPINVKGEDPLIVSTWDFGSTMPQKERRHLSSESFPARMRPPLARALLRLYGKEPVLDPMCGCGTTCLEAGLMGMDSIGIDIEENWIELCRSQLPQIRGAGTLTGLPPRKSKLPTFWRGDVRALPFRNSSIGSIVFSPPYWNAIGKSQRVPDEIGSPYIQSKGTPKTWLARNNPYGQSAGNLGNIRNYGKYLTEMADTFRELWRVLRRKCFCCCVVKDLSRKNRRIPLGADIMNVGRDAGFVLFDFIINRMYHTVFWQIKHAYRRQYREDIPLSLTTHEYLIIFIKE